MTTQRAIGRPAIVLAAAIVVFGAGAMGLVYVATEGPGPPPAPEPSAPPAPPPPVADIAAAIAPPIPIAREVPPEDSKTGETLPPDRQAQQDALEQFRRQRTNQAIERLNRRQRTPRPASDPDADPDR